MGSLRRFLKHSHGATIIEFAFVAPVFFLLLFAIIEFGLVRFTQVAVEAAVAQASRAVSIGTADAGGDRVSAIRSLVERKTLGLIGADQVSISAAVVGQGTTTPPDICLSDPPGTPDTCDPPLQWQENNGIPGYQGPGALSLGDAGDLVEVRVSFPWRVQVPFARSLFGENGVYLISSATVIKNEPF